MIEIKIEDVLEISMRRWYGSNECTVEVKKSDAENILRGLLLELLAGKIQSGLELDDIQKLHEFTRLVIAENEELEAA